MMKGKLPEPLASSQRTANVLVKGLDVAFVVLVARAVPPHELRHDL